MPFRKLYLRWKRRRGQHVLAADCWCKPTVDRVQ
jgi:hypothetical protein